MLLAVVVAFAATRALLFAGAHGEVSFRNSYDVEIYAGWGSEVVDRGRTPYSEVAIEYPPGMLPFVAAPALGEDAASYRDRFIVMMVLVDVLAFIGLVSTSLRWGSLLGPALWVAGTLLLGPVIYLRLDLVPAALTVWAVERAAAGGWAGTGVALGAGLMAKVYPIVLLPAALAASARRARTALGAATATVLFSLPFAGSAAELWRSVLGYHSARGIHAESSWGIGLAIARYLGYPSVPSYSYGAMHVESTVSSALKGPAMAVSMVVLVGASAWVLRQLRPGDATLMPVAAFGTLALVMAAGTVFSPQFVVWLVALGAAGLCSGANLRRAGWWLGAVLAIAALTQLLFPYLIGRFLEGDPAAVSVALARNLLVAIAGVGALASLRPTPAGTAGPGGEG
ncbi:MAG: glycosyltransferase 87 family protein [Actinomycetota bacterium]